MFSQTYEEVALAKLPKAIVKTAFGGKIKCRQCCDLLHLAFSWIEPTSVRMTNQNVASLFILSRPSVQSPDTLADQGESEKREGGIGGVRGE